MKETAEPRSLVLVTGAAGSVGHFVVQHLLETGCMVRALDRPGAGSPVQEGPDVQWMAADLTGEGVVEAAVQGVDTVIHAAAIEDIGGTWDELAPVNYHATLRLYDAASEEGVGHFVFVSTASVYASGPQYQSEDAPKAVANDYVRTKLMSERHLREHGGRPTVNIVRPGLIYGPRAKVSAGVLATVPPVLRLFTDHMVTVSGGPSSNWVHSQDVARALVFLAGSPQPHGQAFNVANDDPVSLGDMFSVALRAGGVRMHDPRIPFPTALVRALKPLIGRDLVMKPVNQAVGALYRLAARKAGLDSPLRPSLDKETLDYALENWLFDNRLLKSLGFKYKYPRFEEGWMATQDWYERNRWVPAGG